MRFVINLLCFGGNAVYVCGMEKVTVNGTFLFALKSEQDWIKKCPKILPNKTRAAESWVWVDVNGDVFEAGRDFMAATKKGTYPCKVYRLNAVGA